jgi:hypothetical protein
MSSGELPSVKVGRSRRVRADVLEQFIEDLDGSRPNMRSQSRSMRSTTVGS